MTPQAAINILEAQGIEAGIQGTYFGDQVYVHLFGNNSPALIYSSVEQFLRWVDASPLFIAQLTDPTK